MEIVGIWETSGALEQLLLDSLSDEGKCGLLLRSSPVPEPFFRGSLHLLVVAPDVQIPKDAALPPCRRLLLPGSGAELIAPGQDGGALEGLSYGASSRDSLTFSSIEGARLSLSIQREFLSLTGDLVERQEMPLQRIEGADPLLLLACAGLLLLLGKKAEEVPRLLARY